MTGEKGENTWKKVLPAEGGEPGDRADRELRRRLRLHPELSALGKRALEDLFELGGVRNAWGKPLRPGDTVEGSLELRLPNAPLGLLAHAGDGGDLPIFVSASGDWGVVNKGRDMPTLPLRPWERGTLAQLVAARLQQEKILEILAFGALAEAPSLEGGLVQRLDRHTTGAVVFTLTKEAKLRWRQYFSNHQVTKTYLALAAGRISDREICGYLAPQTQGRQGFQIGAGEAKLELEVLQQGAAAALIRVRTSQGGRHVVRAALAAVGAPLLGDVLYGAMPHPSGFYFLHAETLQGPGIPKALGAKTDAVFQSAAGAALGIAWQPTWEDTKACVV